MCSYENRWYRWGEESFSLLEASETEAGDQGKRFTSYAQTGQPPRNDLKPQEGVRPGDSKREIRSCRSDKVNGRVLSFQGPKLWEGRFTGS